MAHTYAEIPDTVKTKPYFPLGRHLWRVYQQVGFEYYNKAISAFPNQLYPALKRRLDETIFTAQAVTDGKIEDLNKTCAYMLFPPVGAMRADLQQGTMKLLYGDSCDTTFVVINDYTQETYFLLNAHSENGIPVDWWYAGPEEDLLERRHLKFGYKIRDLPQKVTSLTRMGEYLIDILRDVRNERAPEYADSAYQIGMVFGSGVANIVSEASNWEAWGQVWDGIAAKREYNLPDYWYCYVPWPPLIQTLIGLGRSTFIKRLCALCTDGHLAIQPIETYTLAWVKETFPEVYDALVTQQWTKIGVPTPAMSVKCTPPALKHHRIYRRELFDFNYPEGTQVFAENLGLTPEELMGGAYLDITIKTPLITQITPNLVISNGWGRETKIIK
ncbi:MAG: hypothetical protein EU536_04185 [Promethearchaeota archaeon]|nr:MAG: hypothetical protein EU536_04185 [Candidatus Lokiarchaeota archaeon]